MRAAAFVALVVVAGCSPALRDGVIPCGPSNECPDRFTCWESDDRCHQGAERDGGVPLEDVGPIDAPVPPDAPGAMRNVGNACTSDAMCTGGDRCGGGACFATCTPSMPPTGAGCAGGEECIPTPMHVVGFSGVCARVCTGGMTCPPNFECNTMITVPHCFPAPWF